MYYTHNLKFGFQDNQFLFNDAYENALNDLQKRGPKHIFEFRGDPAFLEIH